MAIDVRMIDNERVAERISERATGQGMRVFDATMRSLSPHAADGIITTEQVEDISRREARVAEVKHRAERLRGLQNDPYTHIAAGVTALLFEGGKKRIDQQMPEDDRTLHGPFFEEVGKLTRAEDGIEQTVFRLDLPEGIFDVTEDSPISRVEFFTQSQRVGEKVPTFHPREKRLSVFAHDVLRIVGAGGELWQNPRYGLNGTRLDHRPAVGITS